MAAQRVETGALHVSEQPVEAVATVIACAACHFEREIDGLECTAREQRAVGADGVGGGLTRLGGRGKRNHAIECDAGCGELGVERTYEIDNPRIDRSITPIAR